MLHQVLTSKKGLFIFALSMISLVSWNLPTVLENNQTRFDSQSVSSSNDESIFHRRKKVYKGSASYYHNKFHGRKTASGERYNKRKLTAAVKMNKIKVPFGTIIEITNKTNGKKVRVKVNDKIPNRSKSIVDLSRAAAKKIDLIKAGRANVEIRVVSKKELKKSRK